MTDTNILKWLICWIITNVCWIKCTKSLQTQFLRSNTDANDCYSELLSKRLISDEQFTASSFIDQHNTNQNNNIFRPSMARLLNVNAPQNTIDGRAWCPSKPVHKNLTEWIQLDLNRMMLLRTVYTMGRGDGNFIEYSPQIVIKYQRTESGPWFTYRVSRNETIISINTDSRTSLRTAMKTIVATRIRIYPLASGTGPQPVCLKIAFIGCFFNDEVVSYTAPQGDQVKLLNMPINLQDENYDGTRSDTLHGGLGVLMDNEIYPGSIVAKDLSRKDIMSRFTGWKCTEERQKAPISIIFYFNQERIFSQVSMYFVRYESANRGLSTLIFVSPGYNNDTTHRSVYNSSFPDSGQDGDPKYPVTVPLYAQKGTLLTINMTCGTYEWIILSEVEIKSTKTSPIVPDLPPTSSASPQVIITERTQAPQTTTVRPSDPTIHMITGLIIVLATILLSCVTFLFYKVRKLRRHNLNKKLEIVAKCSNINMCDPSSRTVFTMQSKQPSVSSIARPPYYTDAKPAMPNTYDGSIPSDGVYASWPNTDEDNDVPNVDKEEEKCLLGTDINDNKSINKDYAVYQPGGNFAGNDYVHNSRPSSTLASFQNALNLCDKEPLSVSNLRIVSSYDLPKSNPVVTYRNSKNVISYQHLINYGGICGDVDLRYQALPSRIDQPGLDSNIKVLPANSVVFVKPWVRGQFGSVDLATVALDNETSLFFMKTLNPDSPLSIKSKFILDLKILSTLNSSNIARLAAIVVDGDLLPDDMADVIRSARFCLLIEHSGGYNLKEFLRNIYYPNQTQSYKSTSMPSPSPFSSTSMLLIVTQISSGMRYLEELGLTHRDVGCRNCTIDLRRQIKIYPGGYVTTQPFEDYCSVELHNHLIYFPLRWLAPESISMGVFTSKSDVWSFGVTMWEVFTLCSLVPYPSLTNEALLELMVERENLPRPMCPQNCPREMYDLMAQCWNSDESLRPRFVDIHKFLYIKSTVSSGQAQFLLPAPPPLVTHMHQSV